MTPGPGVRRVTERSPTPGRLSRAPVSFDDQRSEIRAFDPGETVRPSGSRSRSPPPRGRDIEKGGKSKGGKGKGGRQGKGSEKGSKSKDKGGKGKSDGRNPKGGKGKQKSGKA